MDPTHSPPLAQVADDDFVTADIAPLNWVTPVKKSTLAHSDDVSAVNNSSTDDCDGSSLRDCPRCGEDASPDCMDELCPRERALSRLLYLRPLIWVIEGGRS